MYVICRENPSTHKEEFVRDAPNEFGDPVATSAVAHCIQFATAREAYAWANGTMRRRSRLQWWRVRSL